MLDPTDVGVIDQWVQDMYSQGRIPGIRIPRTVTLPDPDTFGATNVPTGQLGSRLAIPDPSLGAGPLQWDYQVAPETVRLLDNAQDISDELTTALENYSEDLTGFLTQVAQVPGNVAQGIVQDAIAPAIGAFIPTWAWWLLGGVAAVGVYALVSDQGNRRVSRAVGRASTLARAVV